MNRNFGDIEISLESINRLLTAVCVIETTFLSESFSLFTAFDIFVNKLKHSSRQGAGRALP